MTDRKKIWKEESEDEYVKRYKKRIKELGPDWFRKMCMMQTDQLVEHEGTRR